MTDCDLACGCETTADREGRLALVSWCRKHKPEYLRSLYACGECGFASLGFELLERHVYREHLGVQVA
jgi:hypothetical protein